VISFYKNNRRSLNDIVDVSTPESKMRCPKTQDILDLENAFTTLRDKALIWFIASAPVRLETLTKLTWKDLKNMGDKDVPYSLIVEAERLKGAGKGKYKGLKQIGFIHSLAAQKLDNYKQELIRKGYMINDNSPIFLAYRKEKKIARLLGSAIENNFAKASLRAWHNLEIKRFSPHDLRSFFQTNLENAGVNSNIIAPFLGHRAKGIDAHYSDHDREDLFIKYKSALSWLLPQTVEKVKSKLDATKAELGDTQNKLYEATTAIKQINAYLAKNTESIKKDTEDVKQIRTNL
jgi:integrase